MANSKRTVVDSNLKLDDILIDDDEIEIIGQSNTSDQKEDVIVQNNIENDEPLKVDNESNSGIEANPDSTQDISEGQNSISVEDVSPDDLWQEFLSGIESAKSSDDDTLFVKIDSDICYTLDECRINDASRKTMINSILRCFIRQYINRFSKYRIIKVKKTLLPS